MSQTISAKSRNFDTYMESETFRERKLFFPPKLYSTLMSDCTTLQARFLAITALYPPRNTANEYVQFQNQDKLD
jgi:hypothetical protein